MNVVKLAEKDFKETYSILDLLAVARFYKIEIEEKSLEEAVSTIIKAIYDKIVKRGTMLVGDDKEEFLKRVSSDKQRMLSTLTAQLEKLEEYGKRLAETGDGDDEIKQKYSATYSDLRDCLNKCIQDKIKVKDLQQSLAELEKLIEKLPQEKPKPALPSKGPQTCQVRKATVEKNEQVDACLLTSERGKQFTKAELYESGKLCQI